MDNVTRLMIAVSDLRSMALPNPILVQFFEKLLKKEMQAKK